MDKLIGRKGYQVPRNSDLGDMAYQRANSVKIVGGSVAPDYYSTYSDLPKIRPAINLDFEVDKSFRGYGRFLRKSEGYYWDGKSYSICDENLMQYTDDFTSEAGDAEWSFRAGLLNRSTTELAPIGNGDYSWELTEYTGTATNHLYPVDQYYFSESDEYVYSIYVKPGINDYILIRITQSTENVQACFNITTGEVTQRGGQRSMAGKPGIIDVGNGWYRVYLSFKNPYQDVIRMAYVFSMPNDGLSGETYTGTGGALACYLYGPQLERGNYPRPYVKTGRHVVSNTQPKLVKAAVNEPRFDYDPGTGNFKGLLIENYSQNEILNSYDFEVSANTTVGVTLTESSYPAPNGELKTFVLEDDSANTTHQTGFELSSGDTNHTFSFWVKHIEGDAKYVGISVVNNASYGNDYIDVFDLSTGKYVNQIIPSNNDQGLDVFSNIRDYGNGWYRISSVIRYNTANLTGNFNPSIYMLELPDKIQYTGSGSKMYVWGPQFENFGVDTSYIETRGEAVARERDRYVMTRLELDTVSGLKSKNAGFTLFSEIEKIYARYPENRYDQQFMQISGGSTATNSNPGIDFEEDVYHDMRIQHSSRFGFYNEYESDNTLTKQEPKKIAISVKNGTAASSYEGTFKRLDQSNVGYSTRVPPLEPISQVVQNLNTFNINWSTNAYTNIHVKSIKMFDEYMPPETLRRLTEKSE